MTRRVVIVIQRDLLGTVAEYTLVLVTDSGRWPQDTAETLQYAQVLARRLKRQHRAATISIEDSTCDAANAAAG